MKIVTVVGARPQFIKAAVVSRQLMAQSGWHECIIHTGQHYDANMSDVFFDELEIPRPYYSLDVGSGPHGEQTGKMLAAIERILAEQKPDWVLVYGDTNSTLAGALAAAKLHIPIAHIEAGLRSFNRTMPEEVNRVLTDHASTLLLAPTKAAVRNLQREGIADNSICLVGDVMQDAIILYGELAERKSNILAETGLRTQQYALATIHRAENTDHRGRLSRIFESLVDLAKQTAIVVPLHPRTRKALQRDGLWDIATSSLQIIEPVGYLDMIMLERSAKMIITDSGGVQKEAYFFGVPCVTLRNETEWNELIQLGWNRLLPPLGTCDLGAALVESLNLPAPATKVSNPYGQGDAARRIVEILHADSAKPWYSGAGGRPQTGKDSVKSEEWV